MLGKPRVGEAEPGRRAVIRAAVLAYLGRHPKAADSVVGVCRWWLPEEGISETELRVEDVLDELVAEGLLQRVPLPDGMVLYIAPPGAAGGHAGLRCGRQG
jgi:hypothetical protein